MIVPFANWRPVPSHSGLMVAHQGLVLHVQVGDNSCYGEFSVPANQASSTWWVSKTGVLEQYVDSDNAAWTEAAGNFTWDSVETEGFPTDPLTDAQIATLARLYAWGVETYRWPFLLAETPSETGFGWHGMGGAAWGGHFGCPGDLRKSQRAQILVAAEQLLGPVTTQPTGTTTPQEEDKMYTYVIAPQGSVAMPETAIPLPPGSSGVAWISCDFNSQAVRVFIGAPGSFRAIPQATPLSQDPAQLTGIPVGRKIGVAWGPGDEIISVLHRGGIGGPAHPVTVLVIPN